MCHNCKATAIATLVDALAALAGQRDEEYTAVDLLGGALAVAKPVADRDAAFREAIRAAIVPASTDQLVQLRRLGTWASVVLSDVSVVVADVIDGRATAGDEMARAEIDHHLDDARIVYANVVERRRSKVGLRPLGANPPEEG